MNDFKNKKTAVIGIAKSGLALIRFLQEQGAEVTALDKKDKLGDEVIKELEKYSINFRLGDKYLDSLDNFDLVFCSPGVPQDVPEIIQIKNKGKLSSEIELFFELCPAKIIGITGTNGKTTVTTLVGNLLRLKVESKKQDTKVWVGGNIGEPLIEMVNKIHKDDFVVLELSSFQLENLKKSPHISLITNITPDHLDRHKTMESYILAKQNIIKNQSGEDWAIMNYDDEVTRGLAGSTRAKVIYFSTNKEIKGGVSVNDSKIKSDIHNNGVVIMDISEIKLPGEHNLSNILGAIAIADLAGVDKKLISSGIRNFNGVEHRIEFVREIGGVKFYNDSKATTPDSTIAAIKSFIQPVVLIAGGYDKHADFYEMAKIISNRVKCLILIGVTAKQIKDSVDNILKKENLNKDKLKVLTEKNLDEAVIKAKSLASDGDVVILSPACASYDMFKNYEERGNLFKKLVNSL